MPIHASSVPHLARPLGQAQDAMASPDGFIRHGSLSIARSIDRDFRNAEAYLRGDRIMARTFDDLEQATSTTFVTGNSHGDDHFDFTHQTVTWDPHSALRTTSGGRQSPALGLGHELAHANESPSIRARLDAIDDLAYDNREERRVIRGAETHAARTLGEGTRHDHGGFAYHVDSPIALAMSGSTYRSAYAP